MEDSANQNEEYVVASARCSWTRYFKTLLPSTPHTSHVLISTELCSVSTRRYHGQQCHCQNNRQSAAQRSGIQSDLWTLPTHTFWSQEWMGSPSSLPHSNLFLSNIGTRWPWQWLEPQGRFNYLRQPHAGFPHWSLRAGHLVTSTGLSGLSFVQQPRCWYYHAWYLCNNACLD